MTSICTDLEISIVASEGALLPVYASQQAAGADIHAFLQEPCLLQPGESALIPTGLRAQIPAGYEIQIRPRSGLALKEQITVLNSPGTIDADYRGEIGVILMNHGKRPFTIVPGMRIAQMVVAPVVTASFTLLEALTSTSRGEGGFGHTGR